MERALRIVFTVLVLPAHAAVRSRDLLRLRRPETSNFR